MNKMKMKTYFLIMLMAASQSPVQANFLGDTTDMLWNTGKKIKNTAAGTWDWLKNRLGGRKDSAEQATQTPTVSDKDQSNQMEENIYEQPENLNKGEFTQDQNEEDDYVNQLLQMEERNEGEYDDDSLENLEQENQDQDLNSLEENIVNLEEETTEDQKDDRLEKLQNENQYLQKRIADLEAEKKDLEMIQQKSEQFDEETTSKNSQMMALKLAEAAKSLESKEKETLALQSIVQEIQGKLEQKSAEHEQDRMFLDTARNKSVELFELLKIKSTEYEKAILSLEIAQKESKDLFELLNAKSAELTQEINNRNQERNVRDQIQVELEQQLEDKRQLIDHLKDRIDFAKTVKTNENGYKKIIEDIGKMLSQ
jgi:hypothetical protein